MRRFRLVFLGLVLGLLQPGATELHSQPPVPTVKTGPVLLRFNGKDLTGFYPYTHDHHYEDPGKVFSVRDGMLHISGKEFGGVATCGNFSNYHLVTEWKWGERTYAPREKNSRDSGILLHCVGADGAVSGHWMESIECQIIEGGCGDFLMVGGRNKPSLTCRITVGPDKQLYFDPNSDKELTRDGGRFNWWGRDPAWKDVLGFRGRVDVEKPAGDWNRMEVICDGDTITNIVNGVVVNVGTKSSHTQGKIQFQSEGAEILFRTIEIRPLVK